MENPSLAYVSSLMAIALSLLVIAFALVWIAFYRKPTKKHSR